MCNCQALISRPLLKCWGVRTGNGNDMTLIIYFHFRVGLLFAVADHFGRTFRHGKIDNVWVYNSPWLGNIQLQITGFFQNLLVWCNQGLPCAFEGGLILERLSIWLQSPNKYAKLLNYCSEEWLITFFEDWSQIQNLSEIMCHL